jgi:hypothetical protein
MYRSLPALFLMLCLALACAPAPAPAAPPVAATAAPMSTEASAATVVPTETAAPTETPEPAATVAPTETAMPTATAKPTETPEPTAAPTETAAPTDAAAHVQSATLNVRGGPDTAYPVIAAVQQGEALLIIGQAKDCAWLKVTTPQGQAGWVAGGAQFVSFSLACADIPVAAAPPPPTAAPTPTEAPRPTAPPAATAAPAPAPAPAPTTAPQTGDANQGCYLIENFIGAELNITITAQDRPWNQTFKVGPMAKRIYCLDPGRYTYTIDAPPPWNSITGSLDVAAGDRFRWPVRGE